MKSAQNMKLEKTKKTIEPVKLKTGSKLKKDRTDTTKAKQKESTGKVVKSKMKVDCQEIIMDHEVDDEWDGDVDTDVHHG